MTVLLIALGVVLGLILIIALAILLGKIKIHVVCNNDVKAWATILGLYRIELLGEEESEEKRLMVLHRCSDPDRVLQKELRRQRKLAKKALKKKKKELQKALQQKKEQQKAGQPNPNLIENLQMILALVKKFYACAKGNIKINVKKLHITVASKDAATTAILYGTAVQSAAYLLQWIESNFTHIEREDGAMTVTPDYLSEKPTADIDLVLHTSVRSALKIVYEMYVARKVEKKRALKKAMLRKQA